jgi:hypothetical protein
MLASVLSMAERGWKLFPCVPSDKRPLLRNWQDRASSEPATLQEWVDRYAGACNWGVVCGSTSSLCVLDIDGIEGQASLRTLVDQYGSGFTETLTARTARGRHLYYSLPGESNLRNTNGMLGAGLDTRADGGYVVVPPSVHRCGVCYEWIDFRQPVALIPTWLLQMERQYSLTRPRSRPQQIGLLLEGHRNDGLTRLAGAFRRRGATQSEIEAAIFEHNTRRCTPPLPDFEVYKIAASVSRYLPGGPDVLERAWEVTSKETYSSRYGRFLGLCHYLQIERGDFPIALPLERIAELMSCDWTLVRRMRQRAGTENRLIPVAKYIPHRRAAQYRFIRSPEAYDFS